MKLKTFEWLIMALVVIVLAIGFAWAIDEKITVSFTPKTLTASNYGAARYAVIGVEGNNIRYTTDGVTTPTSGSGGEGILATTTGGLITLSYRSQIVNFKAVRDSDAADAVIRVLYTSPQREQ